jgi:hypothetical protein
MRLRGTRPWTDGVVVERDEVRAPVERQHVSYGCPRGHQVIVPFAAQADVQVPDVWPCTTHGTECVRAGVTDPTRPATPPAHGNRRPRTPWQMLRERRTIPELDALLDEALAKLHAQRLPPNA